RWRRGSRPTSTGIRSAHVALAPHSATFCWVNRTPTHGQFPRRHDEIPAGLLVESGLGRPDIFSESGVLEQITVTVLANQCRVMADLPMHHCRHNERSALVTPGHLVVQAYLYG